MTETELIIDLHKNTERQGPGSTEDTLRALGFIDLAGRKGLRMADIGCGTGGQTLTLAEHTAAHITAVDLFPEFLEILRRRSGILGFQERIDTVRANMEQLPFERESLDVIWSEGAIYHMGFGAGIAKWAEYLKPGGYLAVSEITWISGNRPREIQNIWESEYPEIDRASGKIKTLEDNGYSLAGYFYLSPKSWLRTYYQPLEAHFGPFLDRHGHLGAARRVVAQHQDEIALYKKYKSYYSYGFYVAKKA